MSRVFKHLGLNKLSALEPAEPPRRYQREQPGDLIHIDICSADSTRVGHRITGDRTARATTAASVGGSFTSASTMPRASPLPRSSPTNASEAPSPFFKAAAVAYYASLGVAVERVTTDNGSCYRSFAFRNACRRLGLKHIRTRPYHTRTNGKVERFVQTCLREWAYARAYLNSKQRAKELPFLVHRYNWHRPHASIGARLPISRLDLTENKPLSLHI